MQRFFLLSLFLLSLSFVHSYDTGHHNDLTRNALQIFNYSDSAQKVVPLANWFTDYFSYTFDVEEKLPILNLMHFDNLLTLQNVSYYFGQLTINTRNAIQDVTRENNTLKYLTLLGSSLHAIQDFYTHSSWTSIHPQLSCSCYRSETFFEILASVGGDISKLLDSHTPLHTYSYGGCEPGTQYNCFKGTLPHGDYCEGINKDSYVRPYWEQSYAFAFAATVEWLYNVEKWATEISPSFVDRARSWAPTTAEDREDLEEDYEASYVISYSVKNLISEDGHWKGPGAGSLKRLATSFAEFVPSKSIYKALFVDERIHEKLTTPDIYVAPDARGQLISPALALITPLNNLSASGLTDFIAVKVRTTHVKADGSLFDSPNPYAIVTIAGMEFTENVQTDKEEFRPHWTAIKFVPSTVSQVSIEYGLFNDEWPSDDDVIPIGPGKDTLEFTFDISTSRVSGDISGQFNSSSNVFTSPRDDNQVSLFLTTRTMSIVGEECTSPSTFPIPFCEEEAYTELGIHEKCADLQNEQGLENAASQFSATIGILVSSLIASAFH